jgi:hypothetical protein
LRHRPPWLLHGVNWRVLISSCEKLTVHLLSSNFLGFLCGLCKNMLVPVFANEFPKKKDTPSFISTSLSGLGSAASACSLAERRCARAASTGPKTLFLRRRLFALLVLALALLAIFSVWWCGVV